MARNSSAGLIFYVVLICAYPCHSSLQNDFEGSKMFSWTSHVNDDIVTVLTVVWRNKSSLVNLVTITKCERSQRIKFFLICRSHWSTEQSISAPAAHCFKVQDWGCTLQVCCTCVGWCKVWRDCSSNCSKKKRAEPFEKYISQQLSTKQYLMIYKKNVCHHCKVWSRYEARYYTDITAMTVINFSLRK